MFSTLPLPLATLSQQTVFYAIVGLVILILFLQLGFLITAFKRGLLWFLAVLLIPFASLALIIVDPSARRNWILQIMAICAVGGIVYGGLDEMQRKEFLKRIVGSESADSSPLESDTSSLTLEEKQARIRTWQKKLEGMKASLRPGDAAQKAEFDRELAQYLVELEKVKAEAIPGR